MSIIRTVLNEYQLTGNIADFLQQLQTKVQTVPPKKDGVQYCRIDELYGFMPPLEIQWHTSASGKEEIRETIRFHQLDGILILQTQWDELSLTVWLTQGIFYCSCLNLFKESYKLRLSPQLDRENYSTLVQLARSHLELLAQSFNTPLLRLPAIRRQLLLTLEKNDDPLFQNCCLEIFIRLLNQELVEEEILDQEIFLKRAKIQLAEVLSRRAAFTVQPEYRPKYSRTAAYCVEELWGELFIPINLIWGHLANLPYYRQKIREGTPGSFAFEESYHPDGSVIVSEVYPVDAAEQPELVVRLHCDVYREIFPDYHTAVANRKIAMELIRQFHGEGKNDRI